MTKRELCDENSTLAFYSGLGGLVVGHISYGINDFIYLIAGAWSDKKSYHKLKIHYGHKYAYIKLYGYRCRLSDFIKV